MKLLAILAQDDFGFEIPVIGGDIDEIDAILDGCINGLNTLFFPDLMKNTPKAGSPEAEIRDFHAGFPNFPVFHNGRVNLFFND